MANLPSDLQAALDVAARLHAQAMSILSIQRNVGHFTTLVFGVTSLNDGEPVRNSWRDAVGELLSIHATESPKIRAVISQLQPQPTLFTCGGIRAPTASELLLKVCNEIARDYDFVFHERTSEPIDAKKFDAMLAQAGPDYVPPADHMSLLAGIIADRVSLHGPLLQQLTFLRDSIDAEIRLAGWQRQFSRNGEPLGQAATGPVKELTAAITPTPAESENLFFINDSGSTELRFDDERGILRPLKGAKYIREVLARPGKSIACQWLENHVNGIHRNAGAKASEVCVESSAVRFDEADSFQAVLEGRTWTELKAAQTATSELLEQAKMNKDIDEIDEQQHRLAWIEEELAKAGTAGRNKSIEKTPEEKSRQRVTKVINDAIKAIRESKMPKLADFLDKHIETGIAIVYMQPDPPRAWTV